MSVSERVKEAVADRLKQDAGSYVFSPTNPWYVKSIAHNLIKGVSELDFRADFEEGDGGELLGDPPKFCAAHSSAALVVNTFAPFRRTPARLSLAGLSGFTEARFEKKLSTGLLGNPPSLDFFVQGPEGIVAVESKFTETLSARAAKFSDSYGSAIDRLAEEPWKRLFESLRDDAGRFTYLDAAQLLKHYLGIRHSLAETEGTKVLLYLFWEPQDVRGFPEFTMHRSEVEALGDEVVGSAVQFAFRSYSELWEAWAAESASEGVQAHLTRLRDRYAVSISSRAT